MCSLHVAAHAGEDLRAAILCELDGIVANSARAARYKDRLALYRAIGKYAVIGRARRNTQACTGFKTCIVRKQNRVCTWNG